MLQAAFIALIAAQERAGDEIAPWARVDTVVAALEEGRSNVERFQARVSVDRDTGEDRTVTYAGDLYYRDGEDPRMVWILSDGYVEYERLWHTPDRIVLFDSIYGEVFGDDPLTGPADWAPSTILYCGVTAALRPVVSLEVVAVEGHGTQVVQPAPPQEDPNPPQPGPDDPGPNGPQGNGEFGPPAPATILRIAATGDAAFRRMELHLDHATGIVEYADVIRRDGRFERIHVTDVRVNEPFTDANGNLLTNEEVLFAPPSGAGAER